MFKNETGNRFGRLVAELFAGTNQRGVAMWSCRCDCGNAITVRGDCLRNGNTLSCGCAAREMNAARMTEHGGTNTATYITWINMRQRCENAKSKKYNDYGGRGIKVCERWHIYTNFLEDMGVRPTGKSLDRIDTNGDYCKENCRWASQMEQCNNKRNNRMVSAYGETKTMAEWARDERCHATYWTLKARINKGIPPEVAMRRRMEAA